VARVVVVGSVNRDLVTRVHRHPAPGETVLGWAGGDLPGGKGANQAAAAARVGARTVFVGCVGDDSAGQRALDALREAGVDVGVVSTIRGQQTGTAFIQVADSGENCIIVTPGANEELSPEEVDRQFADLHLESSDVVLISLEVPLAAVERAVHRARTAGALCVVNPAPARPLGSDLLRGLVLTPNEHEIDLLAHTSPDGLAAAFAVITTLGAQGCRVSQPGRTQAIPAPQVTVVDTIGAGDVFSGALAAELVGWDRRSWPALVSASTFAVAAASLSTRAPGARDGQPNRAQVEEAMRAASAISR
jgi:ribokinase